MLKKYKWYCDILKIKFKKDISLTLSISMLFIVAGIVILGISESIIGVFLMLLGLSYFLSHYLTLSSEFSQLTDAKQIAFNGFYRYVVTALENGNILYQSLQNSLEYCDEVLLPDVNSLLTSIENDPSLQPFLDFSRLFNDENIKQMIILLYQTQESEMVNNVLDKMNECLISLQDDSIESYTNKEQKKIEKFYMMPIILSAVVMLIVSFFILTMIGQGQYV